MARRPALLRVIESRPLAGGARHLVLERVRDAAFEVEPRGGQFAIFDTGARAADGRALRRCYSFLSPERRDAAFELAVCDVGEGSRALAASAPGRELEVGGPYGKLVADALPERGALRVLATDSGITAALGLVRGAGLAARLDRVSLTWIVDRERPALPETFVRERLPQGLGAFDVLAAEPVGRPARARAALATWLGAEDGSGRGFRWLVGDGDVVVPLEAALLEAGRDPSRLRVECFFHAPADARQVRRVATGEVRTW